MRCHVVYYAYVGLEIDDDVANERLKYIGEQLHWIEKNKGSNFGCTYLVACGNSIYFSKIRDLANSYGFIFLDAFFSIENNFEYPGIYACTQLPYVLPEDDLVLYCHAKGVANPGPRQMGNFKFHLRLLLSNCSVECFDDPQIVIAGVFPSDSGFIWYNYFIARASYLKDRPVAKSPNRHYYESWVRDEKRGISVVKSLFKRNYLNLHLLERKHYTPEELNQNGYIKLAYEIFSDIQ